MQTQLKNSASSAMKNARFSFVSVKESASAATMLVEETLVVDDRISHRPAQAVEDKLSRMLGKSSVGVSQLRLKGLLSARAI